MRSYFIIGTDTDCGKTYVTCRLMEYLQAQGNTVRALKPVASGCYLQNNKLLSTDVENLLAHDNTGANMTDICLHAFQPPIAPHLAAAMQGVFLSAADIASFCTKKSLNNWDYVLVEAAGGLLVPLNDRETWVDVIKKSSVPAILVVGIKLGCINHALLTMSVLESQNVPCYGWIANCLDINMSHLNENISTLTSRITVPLLGRVLQGKFITHHKML